MTRLGARSRVFERRRTSNSPEGGEFGLNGIGDYANMNTNMNVSNRLERQPVVLVRDESQDSPEPDVDLRYAASGASKYARILRN